MTAHEARPWRVAFETLGCKVNQADSDHLADAFRAAGCQVVEPRAPADAYVVNTCTVTLVADRKARKLVRSVAQRRPGAVVAVTGCYAEGFGRALFEAMPEVDVVRGNRDRATLPEAVLLELRRRRALGLLAEPLAEPAAKPRAMLKAQDGCSHVCGFCIVPTVRGGLHSRPRADLLAEAEQRVAGGVRELVLCGIRLGAYGWDDKLGRGGSRGSRFEPLPALVEALAQVPGVQRLRLSSILPLDVGPDLFRRLADVPQVCEHLHLPLQSGDDAVLRAMGRGYTTRRFMTLCDAARAAMPDPALATDVLVGYPGETAAQFEHTLAFCEAVGFADMHIFCYSPRPGTPAADLPDDVSPADKQARSRALHDLRDELRRRFAARRLGQPAEILVEQSGAGRCEGLTRDYLRLSVPAERPVGALVPVVMERVEADGGAGRVLTRPPEPQRQEVSP